MQDLQKQSIPRAQGNTIVVDMPASSEAQRIVIRNDGISHDGVAILTIFSPETSTLSCGEEMEHRNRLAKRIQPLLWQLDPSGEIS